MCLCVIAPLALLSSTFRSSKQTPLSLPQKKKKKKKRKKKKEKRKKKK